MIHISQQKESPATLHLHLEGTLDHEHVVALRDVIREADEQQIQHVLLHCSGLLSLDDSGREFLLALERRGARLIELPITVSWKLHPHDVQTPRRA